jgi:Na+-driven multidrug efflux pump
MSVFSADPLVMVEGSRYLRIVGPFYGFFGAGMALYFASQGAGRLGWPLIAGVTRLTLAAAGGSLAFYLTQDVSFVFAALGFGLAAFGSIIAAAVAFGSWKPAKT